MSKDLLHLGWGINKTAPFVLFTAYSLHKTLHLMLNHSTIKYIFNLYYEPLCRYLFLYTDDIFLIEDTVQTVFTKLWEERESIEIEHIKTYLFISSRNKILNAIRNERRREELLEMFFRNHLEYERSEDIVDFEQFHQLVENIVCELPPKMQEAYRLSREKNLTYQEIATQQGISIRTVENHISGALKQIIEKLKKIL